MLCRQFIKRVMEDRDLSANALGQSLGHANNGFVTKVVNGERPLPLDRLSEWARALSLTDDEREEFIRLAIDDYAGADIRNLIDGLRRDLAKAQKNHALLIKEVRRVAPKALENLPDP